MVASVIEELSPKDERSKLLREKLAIIQEAQVSAVSAGFAAASNLQLLHLARLLRLPQPDNVDGSQVGTRLADFATHWRSLLGNCRHCRGRGGHFIPAAASAHPSKHQFPDQEQPSGSSASRQCLADEGSHRAGHQHDVPRILQSAVPGAQEDRRSATCKPPHGSSTLQDGDARVCPISHQKSGVDGIDRHTRCLPSCSDASGCPQVSAFRGQQEGVPVHLSSVWTGDFSTRVHQAAATCRLAVKAARCEAPRLLRRPADQGRYSRTGSTARPDNHQGAPVSWLHHQLREVQSHTKSRLPVHRDAVQHSTFHSGAPTEDASKGPVSSSALDDQSEHHGQRFTQTSRHAGVHGFAGPARTAPSSASPMVGRHSMVPEDRELVRPDSSSAVGSVRGGLVGISSSPARSTPCHQGDGSNSLHRCVQFGLGSPVRLTLVVTQGQWSASQRSWTQWRWRTSRMRGAGDRTLWCRWPYGCSSGATARRLRWFPSICQECTTSRRIPCPESARHWLQSGQWPWRVFDPCLPSGASHGSTYLRHSPTDDSSI